MSQFIKLKGKLSSILLDPNLSETLINELMNTRFIVMTEYMKEAPVYKGDLRRYVYSKGVKGGYMVSTKAKNNGKSYPYYVHHGTGRFKGMDADFPSMGRMRSGESKRNRGSGGIRPNKFAKRATVTSQTKVVQAMVHSINNLSSQLKEI